MVQIPFCQNCGYCKCKVCNDQGDEFFIEARYKLDRNITEIEVNQILKDQQGHTSLAFIETIDQEVDARGEIYLENYSNCIPGEDGCNCG